MAADRSTPRLALTGATGRVAQLLRLFLKSPVWLDRHADLGDAGGSDALICLAGVTRGDAAALSANTDVAIAALEAAHRIGIPHVLLMSSAAVYGRASGLLTADLSPTPAAPYGTAKAAMEGAVADWCALHPAGPRASILRLGNVAGADALLGNLKPGGVPDLHIFPDGTSPKRSYIGPRSLAHILTELAVHSGLPPIMNLGAPGLVEMADLLRAAGHRWAPVPAPPEAIAEVRLDTAPLAEIVPLPPEAATAQGMVAEWQETRA